MVKRSIYAALLTIGVMLGSVTSVATQAGPEPGSWGVIQTYCVGCHNSKARVGGLALDSLSPSGIAEDVSQSGGEGGRVARCNQHSGLAVDHDLGDAVDGSCNHRDACRHGLDQRPGQAFPPR